MTLLRPRSLIDIFFYYFGICRFPLKINSSIHSKVNKIQITLQLLYQKKLFDDNKNFSAIPTIILYIHRKFQ